VLISKPDRGTGSIATALAGGIRMYCDVGDAIDHDLACDYMHRWEMDAADVVEIREIVSRMLRTHREGIEHIARNLLLRGTLRDGEIDRLL
jgi:hypothetical protein